VEFHTDWLYIDVCNILTAKSKSPNNMSSVKKGIAFFAKESERNKLKNGTGSFSLF
jgi:hypothetical protein